MHGRHRHLQRGGKVVVQVAEVRGQTHANAVRSGAEARTGRFHCGNRLFRQIQDQGRLVDLHPIGPGMRKAAEHFFIDRQDAVQERETGRPQALALAEHEERDRTEEHGTRVQPGDGRLLEVVDRFCRCEFELHARLELRDKEVVVRVEPLGHVHGRDFIGAAGHGEVRGRVDRFAAPGESLRHGADHGRRVEHEVVEREIVRGDVLHAQSALEFPILAAQRGGDGLEFLGVEIAFPVIFHRALELASRSDAGKTEVCGECHSGKFSDRGDQTG